MEVEVKGKIFVAAYFPFFRTEQHTDFDIWSLRLPSGRVEDIIVFDCDNPLDSLRDYASYLITEYVLEDDDMLTPKAIEFKAELKELFYEQV